jgi:hypothetical protein
MTKTELAVVIPPKSPKGSFEEEKRVGSERHENERFRLRRTLHRKDPTFRRRRRASTHPQWLEGAFVSFVPVAAFAVDPGAGLGTSWRRGSQMKHLMSAWWAAVQEGDAMAVQHLLSGGQDVNATHQVSEVVLEECRD